MRKGGRSREKEAMSMCSDGSARPEFHAVLLHLEKEKNNCQRVCKQSQKGEQDL
jgi:hypothetical protein